MNDQAIVPTWWKIFAVAFLRNGENATQAYLHVKPNLTIQSAASESCKLLGNIEFNKVLQEERTKMHQMIDMTQQEWITELVEVAKTKPDRVEAGAKLRALELLGKSRGYLMDRLDLTSGKKPISESFVETIAKLRAMPDLPKITSEDLNKLLECEIVDSEVK